MPADTPPPIPPPIAQAVMAVTPAQLADLDCLSAAYAADRSGAPRSARRMVRLYTQRLQRSDGGAGRDWKALTASSMTMRYDWFLEHAATCFEPKGSAPPRAPEDAFAATWVSAGPVELQVRIEEGPASHRLIADCLRGCTPRVLHVEEVGDTPISLFRLRDDDGLVYSVWGAAPAYRVRVWIAGPDGLSKLLETPSRAWPEFVSGEDGQTAIRTYESESSVGRLDPVLWRYQDGAFSRVDGAAR